mmetsp:Transcript_4828/g.6773  ORF Transcript_4828/g.6773 Transcript_4828/m.6773 type:complete len:548 (+) Transcript_4828:140-1783(+)|eukprot:CAMPEP_0194093540 /NCGR_PEP_ID=MMETSP0149-20130528/50738_1 /TAXON_ID=122233 /ORGANISM="Chaetoceros debilis, Strain MM31A-1" /LENGTH=547 /DNA_ID=CAMNT_0038778879 /DNA_START=96 /DNA_END=1739 /DNA_ORIENTATION=-
MKIILFILSTSLFGICGARTFCSDNGHYKFNQNPHKTCGWVKENPEKRCRLLDMHSVRVEDECQETCGSCSLPSEGRYLSKEESQKQNVGQYCQVNSDCDSWSCKQNICYQSDECQPLKHFPGEEFDENKIVLVFVGSGFTDLNEWRYHVARTFNAFDDFEFFGFENQLYNAFYVDLLETISYCDFECAGNPTLLCCDIGLARRLSNKCFPPGAHLQTIVIENDDRYGGGGYLDDNMATTSIHQFGPKVAVHEMGHSLFELGDEYSTGYFTDSSANCDVEGCSKWADLDEHLGGGLCVERGCQNGSYFVGERSFMQYLDSPFGEVNTRYTCCTFLALTGSYPSYCERYEFGVGLVSYCSQDHQGYGTPYDRDGLRSVDTISEAKYTIVIQPATLLLDLSLNTYVYESNMEGSVPKLFKRRKYMGDFADFEAVLHEGADEVIKITIEFESGEKYPLYFSVLEALESPPSIDSEFQGNSIDANVATFLEIVVDARKGVVVGIDMKNITIHWWHFVGVVISKIWGFMKNVFTRKSSDDVVNEDLEDFFGK